MPFGNVVAPFCTARRRNSCLAALPFLRPFLCPQGGENVGKIVDLHFWQDSVLSMPFGSGSGPGSHDASPELSARQRLRLLACFRPTGLGNFW